MLYQQNPIMRQMMKDALLKYHGIFPSPAFVLSHWFSVIGNAMEWDDNGFLREVSTYGEKEGNYVVPDYRSHGAVDKSPFDISCDLEYKYEVMQYNFITENIEDILNSDWVIDFASHQLGRKHGSYVTTHISPKYARGINFPDNIHKDWASLLAKYLDWWIVELNKTYRVGDGKPEQARSHWPEDIKLGAAAIDNAIKRLHPILNNGESYEEGMARRTEFLEKLMKDLV